MPTTCTLFIAAECRCTREHTLIWYEFYAHIFLIYRQINHFENRHYPLRIPEIAYFMGPTWDPSGADRTQVGLMLTPWTLLSGSDLITIQCSVFELFSHRPRSHTTLVRVFCFGRFGDMSFIYYLFTDRFELSKHWVSCLSNHIPPFKTDVITYLCSNMDTGWSFLVKEIPGGVKKSILIYSYTIGLLYVSDNSGSAEDNR